MLWSNMSCLVDLSSDPLFADEIHIPALTVTFHLFCSKNIDQGIHTNYIGNYNFQKTNLLAFNV